MPDVKDIQQVVVEKTGGAAAGTEQRAVQSEMITAALTAKSREQALKSLQGNLSIGVSTEKQNHARENIFNNPGTDQDRKRANVDSYITRNNKFLRGELRPSEADWGTCRDQIQHQLESSAITGEMYQGLTAPQKKQLAESVMHDGAFRTIANQRLHEVASRVITEKDKQDRLKKLQDENPSAGISIEQAAGQLEQEYQDDLNGVLEWSMQRMMEQNLDIANNVIVERADEVDGEVNKRLQERGRKQTVNAAKRLEQSWNAKGALNKKWLMGTRGQDGSVRQDFEKFMAQGLQGVMTTTEWDAIKDNPDLIKEYEKQLGESLLLKRFSAGSMSQEDFMRLTSAPWMGGTVQERIDNLQSIVESNKKLKGMMNDAISQGLVDRGFWGRLAGEHPQRRLALLAMLFGLAALPAAGVAAAAVVGGGTLAGGEGLGMIRRGQV